MQRRVLLLICWIEQPYELELVLYQQAPSSTFLQAEVSPQPHSAVPASCHTACSNHGGNHSNKKHADISQHFSWKVLLSLCFVLCNHVNLSLCTDMVFLLLLSLGKILDFLVSNGRTEQASCQSPAGKCLSQRCAGAADVGWTDTLSLFLSHPTSNNEEQELLAAAFQMCPDKAASSAVQDGSAASWKGTPAPERLGRAAASRQGTTTSPNVHWNQKHPHTQIPESR